MPRKSNQQCQFKPFELDPDVCDTCGKLHTQHPGALKSYSPFKEAMWKVLLDKGGIHSYYGGTDVHKTIELKVHLGLELNVVTSLYDKRRVKDLIKDIKANSPSSTPCAIDWKQTAEPRMDTIAEFAGTFADSSNYVAAVVGSLYCKCKKYYSETISLEDLTIGQLIWHAVKAGEISGG